ncbi:MAG: iron complex outermembrane receptor protein [Gammaproteobacteria bacterium]|jgi:iron complex outermembrane receptor protein
MLRIIFLLLSFQFATAALAEAIPSEEAPVIVSATRWETSGIQTAGSIKVITRDQIIESGANNVTEILQGQGGLQITDLFGDGSRSVIDMRGFGSTGSANTLMLIDGRRINNTDLASPRLNNIFIKDIERIEITQGSSAVLYGDQAVGGVVNIITRRTTEFEAGVVLEHGSYDYQSQLGHVSHKFENGTGIRASAQRKRTDGFRDNNKTSYDNAFINLSYESDSSWIFAEYQRTDEELGLPGALTATELAISRKQTLFPLDFNDSTSDVLRIGGSFSITPNWNFATEYTHRKDDVAGVLTGLSLTQDRRQKSFSPRIKGIVNIADRPLTVIVGSDIERNDYILVSPFGSQIGDQDMDSIYGLATLPVNEFISITGGFRKAWHERALVDGFRFPPGDLLKDRQTASTVGITINPTVSWRVFLKREDNYRFPLLDEEMNVFTLSTPLETQTGVSYEIGTEWYNNWFQTSLTAYFLDIENEINVDPTAFLENINLDETEHAGLIYEIDLSPLEQLSIGAQYTYTKTEITAGTFADNDIPLVAEHQLHLNTSYQFMKYWNLHAEMLFISDRTAGGDFTGSLAELDGHEVANLNLKFDYGDFSASARVNNLLDEEYNGSASVNFFGAVGFYPAPERNFIMTVGYKF